MHSTNKRVACIDHHTPLAFHPTPHVFLSRAYMETDSALETARQVCRDQRLIGARDRIGRTRCLEQCSLFQMVGLDAILLAAVLTRCALFYVV
jgi:hypothetical protein